MMGRPYVPSIPHLCEFCGGGFSAFARDRRRFCGKPCAGKASRIGKDWSGSANPRFRGGLSTSEGRTVIVCRDGSWIFYYRGVMAAHLGRELGSHEIVHHINGDPTDDRIENLAVMTREEHIELHRAELVAA